MSDYPFNAPINPDLGCCNCPGSLLATAHVINQGEMSISGLNGYRWVHAETGSEQCLPWTTAQPYDGWEATRRVEAALRKRWADEDVEADS